MNEAKDSQIETLPEGWAHLGGAVVMHVTGLVAVAVCVAWLALGSGHVRWVISAQQAFGEPGLYARELGVHLGLSALLWTIAFTAGRGMVRSVDRGRRVVMARGTAITETLIVMPVLLLLILGIAQLAVNNLAGMLLNYGTHQAARTAWVWQPEVAPIDGGPGRMGVDEGRVEEMARLQLAAAMTPVAPSAFAGQRDTGSEEFEKLRAAFLANQHRTPPFQDSGAQAMDLAGDLDVFDVADNLTFARALDGSTYTERTVRKFSSAYEAAEVDIVDQDTEVGVEVTYSHQITFPLVGPIFGASGTAGESQAPGYYLEMEREAFFMAQVPPNAELPGQ